MKISQLIEELSHIKSEHGDIEVTCTATSQNDCPNDATYPNIFETTVSNLEIRTEKDHSSRSGKLGTRVRLWI